MTLPLLRRLATLTITVAAAGLAAVMLLPALAGYHRYVILTGSMAGTYDPGSIVYGKPVPVADLRVGDVITYAPPAGTTATELVTHRIASMRTASGERVFRTRGDANQSADPWTFTLSAPNQVRASFSVPYAGHIVTALADRDTRMLVIGGPALLIALVVAGGLVRDAAAGRRRPGPPARAWVRL